VAAPFQAAIDSVAAPFQAVIGSAAAAMDFITSAIAGFTWDPTRHGNVFYERRTASES
jgi:hypothetical protein